MISIFFKCDDCGEVYWNTDLSISTVRPDSKPGSFHINHKGCDMCGSMRATLLAFENGELSQNKVLHPPK